MKHLLITTIALISLTLLSSCNDYETYGDKKEKERNAINEFIKNQGITVIKEKAFHQQGDSTSLEKNEYVYMDNTGVYMQIVNKGVGSTLPDKTTSTLLIRFSELGLLDSSYVENNATADFDEDVMSVYRSGKTFTASFLEGTMRSAYGDAVPSGWLVPLPYVRVGRPTTQAEADRGIAHVRLIVPHSQGHVAVAQSYVYPYFYDIQLQTTR